MEWTDTAVCFGHPRRPANADALMAALDRFGIATAWVFGGEVVATHDFETANARVLDLAEKHPGRIVPVGVLNPFEAQAEAPRLIARGMRGIRILTGWGNWISLDNIHRHVLPLAERMQAERKPLFVAMEGMIPMTGGSLSLPLHIRERCPEVCLVLDHLWSALGWDDYLAFARAYPDVWLTLAGLPQMTMNRAVAELGPGRILLGSWLPETDTDLVTAQIERAWGHDGAPAAALARNAERVLAGERA
jgi:predicted TIM-barrel fold metal-dependent hydrolase